MRKLFVITCLGMAWALLVPARAMAQSASVSADPNPFYYSQYVGVSAEIDDGFPWWCDEEAGCYLSWAYAYISVTSSDGYYDEGEADDLSASCCGTSDPSPGQNMQATTYYAHGSVTMEFWYCNEKGDCSEDTWSDSADAQTTIQ